MRRFLRWLRRWLGGGRREVAGAARITTRGPSDYLRGSSSSAIEGHTHFAASFKSRHLISAGEARHMDDLPLRFRSDALAIQDGGRDRRDIRVAKRIFVLFRPDRTP